MNSLEPEPPRQGSRLCSSQGSSEAATSSLVLVCGSRSWRSYGAIYARLSLLPRGTTVMHGDAPSGGDALADRAARRLGLEVERWPANWQLLGKRAGFARNLEMLDEQPDLVLAFWDGTSRGTAHTIEQARKRGIEVEVIEPDPDQ